MWCCDVANKPELLMKVNATHGVENWKVQLPHQNINVMISLQEQLTMENRQER